VPYDGDARWMISIKAADQTAAAFASVDRRMKGLEQQLGRVSGSMQQQGAQGAGMFAMIGRAAGPLAAILVATNVAWRAWEAGMKSGALIDQAAQLGVATDALQAYRLVAAQSGVESQQFDGALQRLTAAVGAANQGNEEAIGRFDRLGVKILDANGRVRAMADLLPEVARGLLDVGSETERNALAQELFGRSGSRVVTMLETLARGTDSVTAAARAQGAVVERDQLEAWNRLDAQLKVTKASSDAALASLGAPIATWALEQVNRLLTDINANLARLKQEAATVQGRAAQNDVTNLEERLAALRQNPSQFGFKASEKALLDQLAAARARAQAQEAADAAAMLVGDTPRYTPPGPPGVRNPTPKTGGGSKARDEIDEIGELIKAIEKLQKEGEAVTDRFGDGMAYAARETRRLNELLAGGYISDGTHARALEEVTRKADEMGRAYRGAAGGWDAFVAGMEQGMADLERANSAFEMGRRLVDEMSDAVTDLATGAEVDFNKILQSFLAMIVQMEMRAAASNIWNLISGKGPTDQGIGGMVAGWLFGGSGFDVGGGSSAAVSGNAFGAGFGDFFSGLGFADGGRPPRGRASLVGENGPELFVPDSAGTVVPAGAFGGATIVISMTNQFGSVVSRAEMEQQLRLVEDRARKGAMAGVLDAKSRGGSYRATLRR